VSALRRRLLIIALALGSALSARPAQANTNEDIARDLFREGAALAQQGAWEQALDRYTRSLKLKAASLTLYSMGVAQKQLGKLVEARESFSGFLAEPSSAATQPYEQPAKSAIEEIDARLGRLTIQVTPSDIPDLVVRIDGVRIPNAELSVPRPINPGPHRIAASASGRAPWRSSILVRDGETVAAALTLVPGDDTVEPPPSLPPPPPAPDRTLPIILMGSGLSIFTTGLAVGMIGLIDGRDARTSDGPDARRARSKALMGDIIGGAGGVMAGAGLLVYLLMAPSKESQDPKKAAYIGPWARGSVAGVEVRF
jgi:hypothetical protein